MGISDSVKVSMGLSQHIQRPGSLVVEQWIRARGLELKSVTWQEKQ